VRFHVPIEGEQGEEAMRVLAMERPLKRTVKVKRKGAPSQLRYVVELSFCLDGREHQAEFSLTDRSAFLYPALLGREFLKDVAVVDPANAFLARSKCDHVEPAQLAGDIVELELHRDAAADSAEEAE